MSMRLNKFLSSCGLASRRKCEEIILAGRVSVNGQTVQNLSTVVDEKKDKVCCDGKEMKLPTEFVYLNRNKQKEKVYLTLKKFNNFKQTYHMFIQNSAPYA